MKNIKLFVCNIFSTFILLGFPLAALGGEACDQKVSQGMIDARTHAFESIQNYAKILRKHVSSPSGSHSDILESASEIVRFGRSLSSNFVCSGIDFGLKTNADLSIWKDGVFNEMLSDFVGNAMVLEEMARVNEYDRAELQAQFKMVVKDCKSCHSKFKN